MGFKSRCQLLQEEQRRFFYAPKLPLKTVVFASNLLLSHDNNSAPAPFGKFAQGVKLGITELEEPGVGHGAANKLTAINP